MSNRFCLRRILSKSLRSWRRMFARRIFLSKGGVSLLPRWIVSLSLLADRLPSKPFNLDHEVVVVAIRAADDEKSVDAFSCLFFFFFLKKSIHGVQITMRDAWIEVEVIVRASIPRHLLIHASVIFKESNRCEILEESGITGRNFRPERRTKSTFTFCNSNWNYTVPVDKKPVCIFFLTTCYLRFGYFWTK